MWHIKHRRTLTRTHTECISDRVYVCVCVVPLCCARECDRCLVLVWKCDDDDGGGGGGGDIDACRPAGYTIPIFLSPVPAVGLHFKRP